MSPRKWISISILFLGFGLGAAFLLAAASVARALAGSENPETQREQLIALEAESGGGIAPPQAGVMQASGIITAPLFIGVDDASISTYLIDPDTAGAFPQFSGFGVWGSAYDLDNRRLLFNNGSTLYEWTATGIINMLGTITAPGFPMFTVVGLGYYEGSLYAIRNVANEGVYEIDTATLSATLLIDYADEEFDFGGFAVDPRTGEFYGLNDDLTPNGTGLFRINLDGSATFVAPYPADETDLDGLAISPDGRAYMVSDQPGLIYVFDFASDSYLAPIPNPWTTSETFAGGAWIPVDPYIYLEKTVGKDPAVCAAAESIEVLAGTDVTYCYRVTNLGLVPLKVHDLVDSELGTILSGFSYNLLPAASVFLTQTVHITQTTTNTATWTAYNPGPSDIAPSTDTATVIVKGPEIQLEKTVGTDPAACATTDMIEVQPGTDVTYCYQITNTGLVTLTLHDLVDSEIGSILSGFPYSLVPGASVFLTRTVSITQTTVNTATWKAYNPGPADLAFSLDTATVEIDLLEIFLPIVIRD